MASASHPTASALLDAGLSLAEERFLTGVSVDEVVKRANVAKGTFYVHFSDRTSFVVALHERFHAQLRDRIREATRGLDPGADRLRVGATAYLDGCLAATGVKAMLVGARGEPAVADSVLDNNDRFARASTADMEAIGKTYPLEAARLFVAMTAEVALLELGRQRQNRKLRAALWEFLAPAPRGRT